MKNYDISIINLESTSDLIKRLVNQSRVEIKLKKRVISELKEGLNIESNKLEIDLLNAQLKRDIYKILKRYAKLITEELELKKQTNFIKGKL